MPAITPANIHEYPVGSKVIVNYGAMYPQKYGVIVAHEAYPADRFQEAGMQIVVEIDVYDEYGSEVIDKFPVKFQRIDDKGIGCHMSEKAEAAAPKKKSPWAQA